MKSKPYWYGPVIVLSIASDPSAGMQVTDVEIIDLILSILDSPYANHLARQFVFASITKISSRPTTSNNQQERIAAVLAGYTTNPELELQQRAVEFASLF